MGDVKSSPNELTLDQLVGTLTLTPESLPHFSQEEGMGSL